MEMCNLEGVVDVSKYYFFSVDAVIQYRRRNSVKSPASGLSKLSEPRLMLQVGRVREVGCVRVSVSVHPERWRCQYSSVD
jgi:hypothetical protein